MIQRTRIINVERKPRKCPVCGESVLDIIYGTGNMTELEFVLAYRCHGIMGGDDIPRRPPIWACSCGCKRFRKVNADGSDAPVKVKMLKNIRKKPASLITWETSEVTKNIGKPGSKINHYDVIITTELGEKETLSITATDRMEAENMARKLVVTGRIGLKGFECVSAEVFQK